LLAIGGSGAADRRHESPATDEPLARMGRVVERFADRIVLTSTESAKSTFLRSSHAVLDGFKNVAVARLVADPVKAIRWAVRHADPRDTVLIVTGDENRSASQSRRLVQRIESQVDSARQDPDVKREEYPATIKMF
jgi:UDP-N-acetylmuramyl tripeptide synthase